MIWILTKQRRAERYNRWLLAYEHWASGQSHRDAQKLLVSMGALAGNAAGGREGAALGMLAGDFIAELVSLEPPESPLGFGWLWGRDYVHPMHIVSTGTEGFFVRYRGDAYFKNT